MIVSRKRNRKWSHVLLGDVVTLCAIFVCWTTDSVNSDDTSDFHKQLPAHVVWAVRGKHAELPCDVTPPTPGDRVNMVLWFKDATGIPLYSLDNRKGNLDQANHWAITDDLGGRTYFQTVGLTPARLRVNNVAVADEGVFRCRIDFLNSPTRNFRVNLTIVVPPDQPVIYDAEDRELTGVAGPFRESYELTLSCHVSGGQPLPEVTWWMNDRMLDNKIDVSGNGLTINRLFIASIPRSFYNGRLQCRARSSVLTEAVNKEVILDIYLKPRTVAIVTDEVLLSAGKLEELRCESAGSVPAARLAWLMDAEPIRSAATKVFEIHGTTSSTLTFRPSPSDDGRKISCRAENPKFPGGIIEDRRQIRVAYPPVVSVQMSSSIELSGLKEGDDFRLLCDVRSNPDPDKVTWYHRDQLLHFSQTDGIIPEGRTLLIRRVSKESSGEYSCAAANREGETRSGAIHIPVEFAPRCADGFETREIGAVHHDTITVTCRVVADPGRDDQVKFRWTYSIAGDVLPIQATRVVSSGLVSSIKYTPTSDRDYGTLSCWASNSVGQQKTPCVFQIVKAKVPQPPEECELRNRSAGGLEVVCVESFDGHLPQHFVLEVSESAAAQVFHPPPATYGTSTMSDQGAQVLGPTLFRVLGSKPAFTLHSLEPGRDYELAVFAVNAKGRSYPPVVIPKVRVSSPMEKLTGSASGEDREPTTEPMAIVLGVLIGAAILILGGIFVTAGLVICRRRGSHHDRQHRDMMNELKAHHEEKNASLYHDEILNMMVPVPAHLSQRPRVPRVRFCTEAIELQEQARTSAHFEEDAGGYIKRHSQSINEPDLIVSRAEISLQPPSSPQT